MTEIVSSLQQRVRVTPGAAGLRTGLAAVGILTILRASMVR